MSFVSHNRSAVAESSASKMNNIHLEHEMDSANL